MDTVDPAFIRKTSSERFAEKAKIKQEIRAELSEHGDIVHIYRLMNAAKKISYTSVVQTLNPGLSTWSPRVIEFAQKYITARKAAQEENATNNP